jgi:hypothetical protein
MTNTEIVGLWTLPSGTVLEALKRAGIIFPDWWKDATKISIRTDEHGLTFIGRRPVNSQK